MRFLEDCCLLGLFMDQKPVTPETVDKGYRQGEWLLDLAIFHSRLALCGKPLNGHYLKDDDIISGFNKLPGDHTFKQIKHLILRLHALSQTDETGQLRKLWQHAWWIQQKHPLPDGRLKYQRCILKYMALVHGIAIEGKHLTPDQVMASITSLRTSNHTTKLRFFSWRTVTSQESY